MKKNILAITFLSLFVLTLNAYASERAVKNYREHFCKEQTTEQLQQQYDQLKLESDRMIVEGLAACEQSGRQALSDCKSYRYGEIRKKLHKNKVIMKAIEEETESRNER